MAWKIKSATRQRPCPVCGHPDWCGFMPGEDGRELVICQRATEPSPVSGMDGLTYVCVGRSKRAEAYIFMEQGEKESRDNERGFKSKAVGNAGKYVQKTMTVIDEVKPLSHDQLDIVYRYMLKRMVLDDFHRNWLIKEGWTDELIEKNLIRTMPLDDFRRFKRPSGSYYSRSPWRKEIAAACAEHFGSLRGVPGFYTRDNNGKRKWCINARSGVIFPLFDLSGKIYGLRIRLDYLDAAVNITMVDNSDNFWYTDDFGERKYVQPLTGIYTLCGNERVYEKGGGKYRPFTSYYEDDEEYKKGFIINTFKDGSQAEHGFGFYACPGDNNYCLYITEGEKKGILGNALLGAPFMSLPGVNSFSLLLRMYKGVRVIDWLKKMGVAVIIVAFDADKMFNEKVLACQEKVVEIVKAEGFMVATAEWNINVGKGIDDILKAGVKPGFKLV